MIPHPGRWQTKPVNSDNDHRPTDASYVSSATSGSSCCKVLSQLTNQGAWERDWNSNTLYTHDILQCVVGICWDNVGMARFVQPTILAKVLIHSKQSDRMDKPSSIRGAQSSFMFQTLRRLHRWKSLLEFSENDMHAAALVVINQRFNWRGTKNQQAVVLI